MLGSLYPIERTAIAHRVTPREALALRPSREPHRGEKNRKVEVATLARLHALYSIELTGIEYVQSMSTYGDCEHGMCVGAARVGMFY
jgi:hypothetical protein